MFQRYATFVSIRLFCPAVLRLLAPATSSKKGDPSNFDEENITYHSGLLHQRAYEIRNDFCISGYKKNQHIFNFKKDHLNIYLHFRSHNNTFCFICIGREKNESVQNLNNIFGTEIMCTYRFLAGCLTE